MGGIHEDLGRIDQSVFIAFLQDTGKDLFFEEQLKKEINEDREAHGKKPLKEKKED